MTALDLFNAWLRARLARRQRHWICPRCGADREGGSCCGEERP